MHRDIQWLTVGDRGAHGVTGADSGAHGMCTVADRGLQGVQGMTGDDRESTWSDRERQGIFIRTRVFKASSVYYAIENEKKRFMHTARK